MEKYASAVFWLWYFELRRFERFELPSASNSSGPYLHTATVCDSATPEAMSACTRALHWQKARDELTTGGGIQVGCCHFSMSM